MIKGTWILGSEDIGEILSLRKKVFYEEMHMETAREADEFDALAMHAVMRDGERLIGTGRLHFDGAHFRLDWICVDREYRGQYVGDLMTRLLLLKASEYASEIFLDSTLEKRDFYRRYGFAVCGPERKRDGVRCVPMAVKKDEIVFPSKCGENCANKVIGGRHD